ERFKALVDEFIEAQGEIDEERELLIKRYYHQVEKEAMRNMVLNERIRLDGRSATDIRPIWCEVDYLPSAHGSAIFTRGETQSLTKIGRASCRERLEGSGVAMALARHDRGSKW